MIFFRDTLDFKVEDETVLTIGKFDGLHMGHKKLLDVVLEKKKTGLASTIFTFNMPPASVITHKNGKVLTTNDEKHLIFENLGIDYFVECPFTDEVRLLEPEQFIQMVVQKLNVKCFVVGTDCHFGHDRKGDYKMLQKYAILYNYEVVVVEKKQYEGRDISSTFVREEIEKGNIAKANRLLGYPYFILEKVSQGKKIGRTIGSPTINQIPEPNKLLPPNGVYAAKIVVDDMEYCGVTNIGVKPTISGNNALGIETNIFNFSEDLYEKTVKVELFEFIRKEKKFDSVEQLKAQIKVDAKKAEQILKEK